jgi:hypothetical protein
LARIIKHSSGAVGAVMNHDVFFPYLLRLVYASIVVPFQADLR